VQCFASNWVIDSAVRVADPELDLAGVFIITDPRRPARRSRKVQPTLYESGRQPMAEADGPLTNSPAICQSAPGGS